jgi:hypothetical protein
VPWGRLLVSRYSQWAGHHNEPPSPFGGGSTATHVALGGGPPRGYPQFCFLFWYFVLVLNLCIFLEMLMCHVMIGG